MLTDRILRAVDELKKAIVEADDIEAVVVSAEMVSYRMTVVVDTAPTEKILANNPTVWYSARQLSELGGCEQAAIELARRGQAYIRSSREDSMKYYMHRAEILLNK